ncbi:hypothetical protein [Flavobacterium capsici]|uniref:Uncharacterized protein n=1 Tax=Flavobacterium capsici TaxID=3075618 RepID=A0AA96F3U9_9FLAO|nr:MULTISPECIES: hypothetical protein [unclassified Flavobacterium]WNM18211.1 hypothetical protein RN608_09310 [Flavobacterium sp. PMR2A8]WNM22262.1 hypothetical protein RN605_02610 [Flavobacterium sp. PMTSA4]
MEDIFNPVYRKDYFEGYSNGLNPVIEIKEFYSDAFQEGFQIGRQEYENMNGKISNGIPKLIVTTKVLEDFLLAGMLGMNIDETGYTPFQIEVIQKWYQSGVEKYDVYSNRSLLSILDDNGIELT